MDYILRDNTTVKGITYYYAIINNKPTSVIDKNSAYVFKKFYSAKNTLENNLPKTISNNYNFVIVNYDEVFKSPIDRYGKITYTYNLNIPDSPVEKNEIKHNIKIQKPKTHKGAIIQSVFSDYDIEEKKQEIYQTLEKMISKIQEQIIDFKNYKDQVNNELSHCDKEINDIQHFIEFNKLNASNGYIIYRDLHNILKHRREFKNTLKIMDEFYDASIKAKNFELQNRIEHYKHKNYKYNPRTEEFEHLFL